MKNVLVFPCGSEIGLEVNRALTNSTHFTLFGGNSVNDHGKYVYRNYIADLPDIEEKNFIEEINRVIDEFKIDFIIPSHDSVILKMAQNQQNIKATIITSCVETCEVCRSKAKTYKLFEKNIETPKVYSLKEEIKFPVFLKPDVGQGTKGTYKANKKEEIDFYLKKDSTLLILEYLSGKEYTVDCFTNKNGRLLFATGRERIRINNGISVNSKELFDNRFQEIATIINNTLSFQGSWFYQVKERSTDELVLMEIAPRIAGTSALFRVKGVNFVQLSLFDKMGVDVSILCNNFDAEIDRALFSRFSSNVCYDYVYIDFDDTIIVNNLVNTDIMKFLYQSKNNGKKIVLLSKHKQDIKQSLSNFSISDLLFDEIIILKDDENKYEHITELSSIFIDDSFSERKTIYDKFHIPVFGLDSIEFLLLWKV
jgi:hypothetical protein